MNELEIPITTREELKAAIDNTKFNAAKAWVAGGIGVVVAGLGVLTTALSDGVIDPVETVTIVSTMLVSLGALFGGVYATPNRAKL